ncbi:hypothetical protein AB1Y20_008100 [Prymnesium parvum]|uniref:Hexosyltransferase n=1 Tax=Prymnesium parvum TaxID=97485 RepID=A0AB34IT91_PRYPA
MAAACLLFICFSLREARGKPALQRLFDTSNELRARPADAAAPPTPAQLASAKGLHAMQSTKATLSTVFLPDKMSTLPYLRANMELLGSAFQSFSIIIGCPADAAELLRLRRAGEAHNQSMPMEAFLHEWREEARQASLVRSLPGRRSAYAVHLITNETLYGINCEEKLKCCNHRRRICKIARARNAVMSLYESAAFADSAFLFAIDSDMCHQWDVRAIARAFSFEGEWSALTANGLGYMGKMNSTRPSKGALVYKDALAWIGAANVSIGVHNMDGHKGMHTGTLTWESMIFDFRDPRPVLVESAFGGFGIYRRSSIVGCRYYDGAGKAFEKVHPEAPLYPCEHHGFHQCVRGPVFLHPELVVEWGLSGMQIIKSCAHSFSKAAPDFTAIDVVAEALKLYGTDGPFTMPFWLWPYSSLFSTSGRGNETAYFEEKRRRQLERKRLKECQGSASGQCKHDGAKSPAKLGKAKSKQETWRASAPK